MLINFIHYYILYKYIYILVYEFAWDHRQTMKHLPPRCGEWEIALSLLRALDRRVTNNGSDECGE